MNEKQRQMAATLRFARTTSMRGEETPAFDTELELLIDGEWTTVAHARNDGRGGSTLISPTYDRKSKGAAYHSFTLWRKFEADWNAEIPADANKINDAGEFHYVPTAEDLVTEMAEYIPLRRAAKKHILLVQRERILEIRTAPTPANIAAAKAKNPGFDCLNERWGIGCSDEDALAETRAVWNARCREWGLAPTDLGREFRTKAGVVHKIIECRARSAKKPIVTQTPDGLQFCWQPTAVVFYLRAASAQEAR